MKFSYNLQFLSGYMSGRQAHLSHISPLASEGEKMGCGFEIHHFSLDKWLTAPPCCVFKAMELSSILKSTDLNLKFLSCVSMRSENSVSMSKGEGQAVPGDPNSSELFTIYTHTHKHDCRSNLCACLGFPSKYLVEHGKHVSF